MAGFWKPYEPGTGQFVGRDPLVTATGAPHAYGSNSPLNFIDPTGLCSIGPVRIGFMSNDDGGCKGSEVIDGVKDYADDVSAVVGGVALGCSLFAWTVVGAACAGIAGASSAALSTIHTVAECLDDGILQAECGWSALQTGIGIVTIGTSTAILRSAKNDGPILRFVGGLFAWTVDFMGGLLSTGISLELTGWYDEDC